MKEIDWNFQDEEEMEVVSVRDLWDANIGYGSWGTKMYSAVPDFEFYTIQGDWAGTTETTIVINNPNWNPYETP